MSALITGDPEKIISPGGTTEKGVRKLAPFLVLYGLVEISGRTISEMGGRNVGRKDQILISGISYSNFDSDDFEGFKTNFSSRFFSKNTVKSRSEKSIYTVLYKY